MLGGRLQADRMTTHLTGTKQDEMFIRLNSKWFPATLSGDGDEMGRRGMVQGKRLPDRKTYELRAFVDGIEVTVPFFYEVGSPLIKRPMLYSRWSELVSGHEASDGTLICSISDIDCFIAALGLKRMEPAGIQRLAYRRGLAG